MADHLPKFKPGQAVTFTADEAIAGGQVVEVGAANRSVKVAGAASAKAIGTAGFSAQTGDKVTVHLPGPVDTAKAAADEFQKLLDKINGKASGTDPDYAKNINLLRAAMGREGFSVNEAEWWHFDHDDWQQYGVGNSPLP